MASKINTRRGFGNKIVEIMEIYGYPWKQIIPVRNSKDNKTISLIT